MDYKDDANLTTQTDGIFISIYKFFLRKKSQSLIFAFKIPVIFLMINNLTSMTLLEKWGKKYHRSIMEVSCLSASHIFPTPGGRHPRSEERR